MFHGFYFSQLSKDSFKMHALLYKHLGSLNNVPTSVQLVKLREALQSQSTEEKKWLFTFNQKSAQISFIHNSLAPLTLGNLEKARAKKNKSIFSIVLLPISWCFKRVHFKDHFVSLRKEQYSIYYSYICYLTC
mgnify:CR=1 FL=1